MVRGLTLLNLPQLWLTVLEDSLIVMFSFQCLLQSPMKVRIRQVRQIYSSKFSSTKAIVLKFCQADFVFARFQLPQMASSVAFHFHFILFLKGVADLCKFQLHRSLCCAKTRLDLGWLQRYVCKLIFLLAFLTLAVL